MGGKETMLMRLVGPPVVKVVAVRFGAVAFNETANAEFVMLKLPIVGWAGPINSWAVSGQADRDCWRVLKAGFAGRLSSVAPLMTWTEELFEITPDPLKASTPLLTIVLSLVAPSFPRNSPCSPPIFTMAIVPPGARVIANTECRRTCRIDHCRRP